MTGITPTTTSDTVRELIVQLSRTTSVAEAQRIRSTLMSIPVGTLRPNLVRLLNDKSLDVRWHTADMLLDINPQANLRHVLKLLSNRHPAVRASLCLRIAEKAALPAAVAPLCKTLLQDKNANVRFWAAYALGAIRDERATKALQRATKDDGLNYEGVPVSNVAEQSLAALVA